MFLLAPPTTTKLRSCPIGSKIFPIANVRESSGGLPITFAEKYSNTSWNLYARQLNSSGTITSTLVRTVTDTDLLLLASMFYADSRLW